MIRFLCFLIAVKCAVSRGNAKRVVYAGARGHENRTAVCVIGAARNFYNPAVSETRERFVDNVLHAREGGVDMFFHLFVGKESSIRGQLGVASEDALQLVQALGRHVRALRFQLVENDYHCGVGTGRAFKVAQCAAMVESVMANASTRGEIPARYARFILMRPDLVWLKSFPSYLPMSHTGDAMNANDSHPRPRPRLTYYGDEVAVFSDFSAGLCAAGTLSLAKCCDQQRRLPSRCFYDGLEAQRPNFVISRHLQLPPGQVRALLANRSQSDLVPVSCLQTTVYAYKDGGSGERVHINSPPPKYEKMSAKQLYRPYRGDKAVSAAFSKMSVSQMHGRARPNVITSPRPRLSEIFVISESDTEGAETTRSAAASALRSSLLELELESSGSR
jgi:hypothetical protein